MPPVEEAAVLKPTIGIIYPPPEVRNIVDRTAVFVARNGPEFEARIRQNELNNPKFNFLNGNDPYNSYYKHKVKEVVEGKVPEPTPTPKSGLGYIQQKPVSEQQQKLLEAIIPKEPPPEFEYIAEAPSISAYDLDVVRLTAQFVARNGRQFLNNLMNRESRNFQFDFLRPQHSLFNYFTKLVEQYTKILLPPKDLIPKLEKEGGDTKNVLSQITHRVEWTKLQEREKKREEDEKEKERVAYAQIDWHDFVAVEVVDFQPHETGNFPPPTIPDEVGARLIAQERYEHQPGDKMETRQAEEDAEERAHDEETSSMVQNFGKVHVEEEDVHARGADTSVQDMEEDSDSEGEDEREKIQIRPPLPKEMPQFFNTDQIIIRKDYNPKARKPVETSQAPDKFLISPITGEKIPADKIQEHMRIGLLDSKWIEQRDKTIQDRREQEEVYAPGSSIGSNLRQLAERRTDIFGSGTEETQIGKKIGEEEKKEKAKVIWDGHSTSMEKVAQKARENITIEDQIAVIHKTKGLLPDEEKEKIGPAMPKNIQSTPQQHTMTNLTPQQPPVFSSAPAPPPVRPPVIPAQPPMRPPIVAPITPARVPLGMMTPLQMQPGMVLMGQAPGQPGVMPQMSMGRPPFLPAGGLMPGLGQPHMIPTMQQQFIDQHEDEPANKRQKTDESLIPADEFIARNASPVEFKVQLPMIEKSEWKLNGQSFSVTLHLTDHVNVIKAKIFEEVGMPPGKQKLQLDGMFLKESNSLAYYNITPHSVVHLQLKERGGRKK